jgi:hypothetical protein
MSQLIPPPNPLSFQPTPHPPPSPKSCMLKSPSKFNVPSLKCGNLHSRRLLLTTLLGGNESYFLTRDKETSLISAYLDISQIIDVIKKSSMNAIHPWYGFLNENLEFACRLPRWV